MRIFILEDNQERIDEFIKRFDEVKNINDFFDIELDIAKSAKSALKMLNKALKENKKYDLMFLDHDLGKEVYVDSSDKNTGYFVIKQFNYSFEKILTVSDIGIPKIIIHSYNVIGAHNMRLQLSNHIVDYNKKVYYIPEVWAQRTFHKYFMFQPSLALQYCSADTYNNYNTLKKQGLI
jgi:hypothetical protein